MTLPAELVAAFDKGADALDGAVMEQRIADDATRADVDFLQFKLRLYQGDNHAGRRKQGDDGWQD